MSAVKRMDNLVCFSRVLLYYKRSNNPLLKHIEDRFQGASIGSIRIPHATCADNLAFLSHSAAVHVGDMVENFTDRARYNINPLRSGKILYNSRVKPSLTIYNV